MSILTRITAYDELEDPPKSDGTTDSTTEKVEEKKKSEPVSENTNQVSADSTNTNQVSADSTNTNQVSAGSQQLSTNLVEKQTPVSTNTNQVGTGSQQLSTNLVEKQTPVSIMRNSYEEAVKINPNLTPGEWIHQEILRRKESGEPDFSMAEIGGFLGGKDPYKTKAETEAAQKRLKRASMVNALGSLLVSLWNVGRTKAGNPAMDLSGMSERGQARINQMREGQEKLARQNYNDYMDAIIRDKAERDALAAEKRKAEAAATLEGIKHQNDLALLDAKQNTPEAKYKTESAYWQSVYNQARAEGYGDEQAQRIAALKALVEQRRAVAEKHRKDTGKGTSGGSGNGGAFHVGTGAYAADGNIYVRSKNISEEEKRMLVNRYLPKRYVGEGKNKKEVPISDYNMAYGNLISNPAIPAAVLRELGFVRLDETEVEEDKYAEYLDSSDEDEDFESYITE